MSRNMLEMDSKIGKIYICSEQDRIVSISFETQIIPTIESVILKECASQIEAYLSGKLSIFHLNTKIEGTDFQKKVWELVSKIPYGKVVTYSKIANDLSLKNGSRAVGKAISKNRLPILIPCHRVVGKSGTLTGYLGGIERKKFLLTLEGHNNQQQLQFASQV